MNIEINLLPEELRPRPPIETKNLIVGLLIVALVACSIFLYTAKSSANSEKVSMQNRITDIGKEIAALQAEARSLTDDINSIKTANKNYNTFAATRIYWGDTLDRLNALKPQGIAITRLKQDGNTLEVGGLAPGGYGAVASYARSLDDDRRFNLIGVPLLGTGNVFTLKLRVAPGGGE